MKFRHFYMNLFAMLCATTLLHAQSKPVSGDEKSYTRSVHSPDLKWNAAPDFFPGCSFAILHGDLAESNLDFFFRIEPNTEVIQHTHNSSERMILISGDLQVQYEGEAPVIMKEGDYAFGPAGKPHKAKCLDNGPCVLFVALVEPFDAMPLALADTKD